MVAFTSGYGAITTPEQARKRRELAESLIGRSETPGRNWAEGLSDVAAALTGTVLQREADEAERAAREELGGLFGGLSSNSSEQDLIAALNNPWASPAQQAVAQTLLSNQFQQNDPYRQLQLAQAQLEYDRALAGDGGGTEYFGTPVPYQLEDGSIGYGQLGKDGSFKPIGLPEGAAPAPATRTVDTPTESIIMDVYGNVLSRIPKDIAGAARQKAVGDAEGAAIVAAPNDIASAEMALDLLDQIENHPELPWATGQSVLYGGNSGLVPGMMGRRDFQNLVDQAKSGAFLSAIQQMRGMGSLSNAEGAAATAAVTRMDTATSEEAFRKALQDYRELVSRGLERARSKLAAGGGAPSIPPPEEVDSLVNKYLTP